MGFYGLLNYEKYLINSLKNSSFSKKLLARIMMLIIVFIVKTHISMLIYIFFNGTFFYDNIFPIIVNIVLTMMEDSIYDAVAVYKKYFYKLSKHIIINYGKRNMFWKRILVLIISTYILSALIFVKIDNYLIALITVQNLIAFFVIDFFNNYNKVNEYMCEILIKPKVIKKIENKKLNELFVEDYIKKETMETNDWVVE